MASYPDSVKSFSPVVDGTASAAVQINDAYDEIEAVQTDLLKAWTSPAFDANDFTAAGGGTWTVASGDVATYAYHRIGKRLTVSFTIEDTTIAGDVSALGIAIPGGFTATKKMASLCVVDDNGTLKPAIAVVSASGTDIAIFLLSGENFAASTNNTDVDGQITIEVD